MLGSAFFSEARSLCCQDEESFSMHSLGGVFCFIYHIVKQRESGKVGEKRKGIKVHLPRKGENGTGRIRERDIEEKSMLATMSPAPASD